jgi:hypothetical protein
VLVGVAGAVGQLRRFCDRAKREEEGKGEERYGKHDAEGPDVGRWVSLTPFRFLSPVLMTLHLCPCLAVRPRPRLPARPRSRRSRREEHDPGLRLIGFQHTLHGLRACSGAFIAFLLRLQQRKLTLSPLQIHEIRSLVSTEALQILVWFIPGCVPFFPSAHPLN